MRTHTLTASSTETSSPRTFYSIDTHRVVVTDFGLAQFIAAPDKPALIIGGTAGYIAPEVRIHGQLPSPPADIYALGALLFALLTGTIPTSFDSAQITAIAASTLSGICAKCLSTHPSDRFQTANQLVEAIDQYLEP